MLVVALVATSAGLAAMPGRALGWSDKSFSSTSEQQLFALTNQARASAGLPSLRWDSALAGIARWRSQDMATRDYFSHNIPPSGEMVFDVMDQKGYCFNVAGENIGWNNYPDAQATPVVQDDFMNSPGHRANIMGRPGTSPGSGPTSSPTGASSGPSCSPTRAGAGRRRRRRRSRRPSRRPSPRPPRSRPRRRPPTPSEPGPTPGRRPAHARGRRRAPCRRGSHARPGATPEPDARPDRRADAGPDAQPPQPDTEPTPAPTPIAEPTATPTATPLPPDVAAPAAPTAAGPLPDGVSLRVELRGARSRPRRRACWAASSR